MSGPNVINYKREEYEIIEKLGYLSSLVPKTYGFGSTADGRLVYMILDFIKGKDGEEVLGEYSLEDQYTLGVFAGRELKKLHMLNAPPNLPDWERAFKAKYQRKSIAFDSIGLTLPGMNRESLSEYISRNIRNLYIDKRVFLHDDYHPANLIINDKKLTGIIDFNRYDWGDPVHEFVKLAFFSKVVSTPFSAGQIDGYNDGCPSKIFWNKYLLYCAMTIIPDILWGYDYSKKSGSTDEIERSRKRVMMVYRDHEGFTNEIPTWYQKCIKPYQS